MVGIPRYVYKNKYTSKNGAKSIRIQKVRKLAEKIGFSRKSSLGNAVEKLHRKFHSKRTRESCLSNDVPTFFLRKKSTALKNDI